MSSASSLSPVRFLDSDHSFFFDPRGQTVPPQSKNPKVIANTYGLHSPPRAITNEEVQFSRTEDDVFVLQSDGDFEATGSPTGYDDAPLSTKPYIDSLPKSIGRYGIRRFYFSRRLAVGGESFSPR